MAIENRDLGTTQQRETIHCLVGQGASSLVGVGVTQAIAIVPFPSYLAAVQVVGFGISGAPSANIDVTRYNAAGVTTITGAIAAYAVGATVAAQNGATTVSAGSPLVNLQTNDILSFRLSGANTAFVTATVTLVLQALQDVKTHFNR